MAELLELERVDDRRWVAQTPAGSSRPTLYGGLVAAQALRAGHESVDSARQPHSMHAYFLRAGRFDEPLEFHVDVTRDGRTYSARRIEVTQSRGPILTMVASYQTPQDGDDYQIRSATVPVPSPSPLSSPTGYETGTGGDGPFEVVEAQAGQRVDGSLDWSPTRYWCRTRHRLGDSPIANACALVTMGDLRTHAPPRAASTLDGEVQMTSLDYSMWFHRDASADGWHLFDLRPGGNGGARGLTHGLVHSSEGLQVASFAMELLMRGHRGNG